MCHGTMSLDATIVPKPPEGRLPFLLLLARVVSNSVASWGRDFYEEPIVVYDEFGLQTVFVMDPELIQAVLLGFSKSSHLRACPGRDWRRGSAHR